MFFLTGYSGSGKSLFLENTLLPQLKKKYGEFVIFKNDNFEATTLPDKNNQKYIVIYDQFEKALGYIKCINKIHEFIKSAEMNRNTLFIFSFPHDQLDKVYSAFTVPLNHAVHVLSVNTEDLDNLERLIIKYTGKDDKYIAKLKEDYNKAFHRLDNPEEFDDQEAALLFIIYKAVEEGRKPLVSFFIVGYILENYRIYSTKGVTSDFNNPEDLIYLYLNDWSKKLIHKRLAEEILYLLSDGKSCTVRDLRNITFADKECFEQDSYSKEALKGLNIISALQDNMFIRVHMKSNRDSVISTRHDYASEVVRNYCNNELPAEMRNNVDYYRNNIKTNGKKIKEISERYNWYWNKSNRFIYTASVILGFAVLIVSIICSSGSTIYDRFLLILISLCCYGSTYYIYNYCKKIMRVFDTKYYRYTVIFGMALITSCYVLTPFWAVFLGVEIFVLVWSFRHIIKFTEKVAQDAYRQNCLTFGVLASVVILLGLLYGYWVSDFDIPEISNLVVKKVTLRDTGVIGLLQEFVYYVLFIFYVIMASHSHINDDYVLTRIGIVNMISNNYDYKEAQTIRHNKTESR